jgi:hypothetical protein
MFPVARHHGMTGIPYLEDAERPEGETGMSEVPHICGTSLPVSVERFLEWSGMECRSAKGISFLQFERTVNGTVKLFAGQDYWFIGSVSE